MAEKCASCGILFGVPCPNMACDGHQNERAGEVCVYCATNARTHHALRKLSSPIFSTLYELGHGED
jgi:hypothetical protein